MYMLLTYKLINKAQGIRANQKKYTRPQKQQKSFWNFQKLAPQPHTKTSQCPHFEN